MKKIIALGALTTGVLGMTNGCADQTNVFDESNNAYCEPAVKSILYKNIGGSGQYETVSSIAGANDCTWTPVSYGGPLAPYDEEIGIILRGPLKLRAFAAYSASASASKLTKGSDERKAEQEKAKRSARASPHERRHAHGHQHFHQHQKEAHAARDNADAEKRGVGAWVTATIDGQVVSWINTYAGETPAAQPDAGTDQGLIGINVGVNVAAGPTSTSSSSIAAEATPDTSYGTGNDGLDTSGASGEWKRISYYNAETKTREGLTFLSHPPWQNRLAFAGTSSNTQAADSTTFGGELDNADELIIVTDSPCSEDIGTDCPYYKPGDEAFHGFGGTKKAFYFEFMMPDSGLHCSVNEMASKYVADNMPAIWTLNAKILTDQYGCNCQASGCGELDLFEVLNPGNKRMKSTFHGNNGFDGGDSHYIERPFDYYMSAIAVLDEDKLVIQVLDNGTQAPASLTQAQVNKWMREDEGEELSNILGDLAVFAMSLV